MDFKKICCGESDFSIATSPGESGYEINNAAQGRAAVAVQSNRAAERPPCYSSDHGTIQHD
jgi:hypothetical protein